MNSYFEKFNYSLANEDASLELVHARESRNVLAICGSGARVIPHLSSPHVQRVTACDISADQLTYLRLKRALVQQLTNLEVLLFLGYLKTDRSERLDLLERLSLPEAEARLARWDVSLDEGLIYQGAWEKRLRAIGRRIRALMRVDFTPLFEASSLEEQREIFARMWPRRRLAVLLKIFASRRAINRAVYGGGLPTGESLSEFLISNFETYFTTKPARSSFFHQLLFLGEVRYQEGWPIETRHLDSLREHGDKLQFHLGDFSEALTSHDFLSLSDVASYLPEEALRGLSHALPRSSIEKTLIRTFQRHPRVEADGFVRTELAPFDDVTGLYRLQLLERGLT